MIDEIKESMARTFFASAYADAWNEATSEGVETGINPSGCDWMDLMPSKIDPAATHAAETLTMGLARVNHGYTLEQLYTVAWTTQEMTGDYGDRDLTPEMFGHYLAMQAMGHGVGLSDAFGDAVRDAIHVPSVEFGAYSLSRDYFGHPYQIIGVDAWTDGSDGWTVNQEFPSGEFVAITYKQPDAEILDLLIEHGTLKDDARERAAVSWHGTDPETIEISDKMTGEPLFMLVAKEEG